MSVFLAFFIMAFFSIMAFWKANAQIFMICGGVSLMTGLYTYDVYTSDIGLSISLMFIAYAFLCLGLAFRCIFWREDILE